MHTKIIWWTYSHASHVNLPARDVVRNVSIFIDRIGNSAQCIVTTHWAENLSDVFAKLVASPALQNPALYGSDRKSFNGE